MANSRYRTAEALENSRRSSREAKRRRAGTCVDCGGRTGYNGHGTNGASVRCARCNGPRTADMMRRTGPVRAAILAALSDGPMGPSELAARIGVSVNHTNVKLQRLMLYGDVVRVSRGVYSLPSEGAVT